MDKQYTPLVGIVYKLANGKQISIDVSIEVKNLLEQTDRQIRSQKRKDRRYLNLMESVDELDTQHTQPQEDTAALIARIDSYKLLYAALEKLSDDYRRRIILYHFYDLTYREIADVENVHYSTVSRSVKKALMVLKGYLTE